jgi:type IV pilus biogenesis protein CpaD/CtpE
MKTTLAVLALALLAGCATTATETEYRQPWTVYKTRADIVK